MKELSGEMRILYCFDVYHPSIGGGEVYYQKVAEAAAAKGNEVTLVTIRTHAESPAKETLNGVNVIRIKVPARIAFALFALPAMLRLSKDADLIHTSTFAAAFPAYLAAKIRRKPSVITIHEIFGTLWFRFLPLPSAIISYYGEKLILALGFSAVISPSRYTTNSLRISSRKIKDDALHTIYHGVDTDAWKYTEANERRGKEIIRTKAGKTVLFFGRAGVSKGQEYVLAAMSYVKDPEAILAVITPHRDPRFAIMKKIVEDRGLQDRVTFYDSLPFGDLVAAASAADVIVIPSLVEGFGFVAAESSALGKKLVVSSAASLPEAVSGEVVFVAPSSAQAIAKGIDAALKDKTESIPVKHFHWKDSVQAHMDIYSSITSK